VNYSVFHVETYGHGTRERNNLADVAKVTIEDHDGHFFVYECDSDNEAQSIAQWFCDIERETRDVRLEQHDPRAFSVSVSESESFLSSGHARETSPELMEAIYCVAGRDDTRAVDMWENGVTDDELATIIKRVTHNGLHDTTEFCWGELGNDWASLISES
jgi:hypothetical protein